MGIDESFKRPGEVPFKWEIRPGTPKPHPSSTNPPQMLNPPPAGTYFNPPPEIRTRFVRSSYRLRSDSQRFDQPRIERSTSVSPGGCLPSPLFIKRKGDKKRINKVETEFDYASQLETLARWSMSTRKSFSFRNSPSSSSSSNGSSPRPLADAEWAGFGLF